MTSRQIEDAALKGKKCCTKVKGTMFQQCGSPAKVMRDGKPYCLRHDPVKRAEKRAAQAEKWKAELAADKAIHEKAAHLRACERAVVEAAERWETERRTGTIADNEAFLAACANLEIAVAALREARGK
jgi:hypothetical protein